MVALYAVLLSNLLFLFRDDKTFELFKISFIQPEKKREINLGFFSWVDANKGENADQKIQKSKAWNFSTSEEIRF
jgi:hypothetical protein